MACFTPQCDWSGFGVLPGGQGFTTGNCEKPRSELAKCPLFDAVVLQSIQNTPGVAYLEPGHGFTVPPVFDEASGEPFRFEHGHAGRCVSRDGPVCTTFREDDSSTHPPQSGIRDLLDGEAWCTDIINYNGRVLSIPQADTLCYAPPTQTVACTDLGKAWGKCAKPKLPCSGHDYDTEDLKRILSMSLPDLFAEQPGCGSSQLIVQSNSAGRHGGGLYQDACDNGLQQRGFCWVGGISDGAFPTFTLSFEFNTAGGAGGAVYTVCHNLDVCQGVAENFIGLPDLSGEPVKVFSFRSNDAAGFGNDIASAPRHLAITQYAKMYMPGKDSLNLTFYLSDSLGQSVIGSEQTPIAHMIQVLVLPVDAECATFDACELAKLQPPVPYLSIGTQKTTSLVDDFDLTAPLKFCQVDVKEVNIRLFVMSSPGLDAPSHLPTLQQTMTVTCVACEPGWTRVTEGGLWTCKKCELSNYIIDPNRHNCEPCPDGATCDGSQLTPKVDGSVWDADVSTGVYRLSRCPPGYVLIRDETFPVLDRCVACPPDTYSVDEALFGQRLWTRSVENYLNNTCKPCPRRAAMCVGADNLRPLPGTPPHSQCAEHTCAEHT